MGARQSAEVKRAIEMLRADPKLTRYQAAKAVGITTGALYNSKACKELMAERRKKLHNTNNKQSTQEASHVVPGAAIHEGVVRPD